MIHDCVALMLLFQLAVSECQNLAQIGGHLSEKLLKDFPSSTKVLTMLWSKDDFEIKLRNEQKLKKLFIDVSESYKAVSDFELTFEPDNLGGFCLVNRLMSTIKPCEIEVIVGLFADLPKKTRIRTGQLWKVENFSLEWLGGLIIPVKLNAIAT